MTDSEEPTYIQKTMAQVCRLEPNWNIYQYLFVFFIGCIGDIVVHILASNDVMASSLMPYYNSLKYTDLSFFKLEPGPMKGYLYGAILGGVACVIALLGADIILQIIKTADENKKES